MIRLTEEEFKALDFYEDDAVYFLTDCGMIIMPNGGEIYLNEFKDDIAQDIDTEYKQKYLFNLAEMDNFRNRVEAEKRRIASNTESKLIKELLPIIDNFERSKQFLDENSITGMMLIFSSFLDILAKHKVELINPSKGEKFDENYHEAVMTVPAAEGEEKGIIRDCIEKGYTLADNVIRFAKVSVTI